MNFGDHAYRMYESFDTWTAAREHRGSPPREFELEADSYLCWFWSEGGPTAHVCRVPIGERDEIFSEPDWNDGVTPS